MTVNGDDAIFCCAGKRAISNGSFQPTISRNDRLLTAALWLTATFTYGALTTTVRYTSSPLMPGISRSGSFILTHSHVNTTFFRCFTS